MIQEGHKSDDPNMGSKPSSSQASETVVAPADTEIA